MEDSIYRLRQRDILTLCGLALLGLGIIMVQSASMNVTGQPHWQWTQRGIKHLSFAMVAIVTYFLVGNIDYTRLGRSTRAVWRHPVAINVPHQKVRNDRHHGEAEVFD